MESTNFRQGPRFSCCTGQALAFPESHSLPRVYPRVCGGTTWVDFAYPFGYGLSPRVGETAIRRDIGRDQRGLSPRVPGNLTSTPDIGQYPSLSPRVRGNRGRAMAIVHDEGSIPACTGEPTRRNVPDPRCRVYPRVYGGTLRRRQFAVRRIGLSPRVRGNQPGQTLGRTG